MKEQIGSGRQDKCNYFVSRFHMKRHSALLFPETVPDEQVLLTLVPVFQSLVYCQPSENSQAEAEECFFMSRELSGQALFELVVPAPLGEDRERFFRLLSDLRSRQDDYAAQLSRLSLASMGETSGREAETKSSILSTLLDRHGIQRNRPDRRELVLWQARLVLKLGEFFDEDQRFIRQEMEKISAREQGLLSELCKEPGVSQTFSDAAVSESAGDANLQTLRMKAWARIFSLGGASPEECRIFVTRNKDAYEMLAEEYERLKGETPRHALRLALPGVFSETSRPVEQLQRFICDAETLYGRIGAGLQGEEPEESLASEWENMVEQHFPSASHGRREMNMYLFDKVAVRRFFLQSFCQDEDMRMAYPDERERDIVIGLLS